MVPALFEWLETSVIATEIRRSTWLYPFIEIIHIFGIVLVSGAAAMFDLQLLSRATSTSSLAAFNLLKWSRRGLLLALPSGVLLFLTNAVSLANDPVMWSKMTLLLLAGVNAYLFHIRIFLPATTKDDTRQHYSRGRVHAMASLLIWMGVIATGRLLAY